MENVSINEKVMQILQMFWGKYQDTIINGIFGVVIITFASFIAISTLVKLRGGKNLHKEVRAFIPIILGPFVMVSLHLNLITLLIQNQGMWGFAVAEFVAKGLILGCVTTSAYDIILKRVSSKLYDKFGISLTKEKKIKE